MNLDGDEEDLEEDEEENQSFQTMIADNEAAESHGEETPGHVTSFYGPEKPQYDEMVSIIQTDTNLGDLIDESIVNQIEKLDPDQTIKPTAAAMKQLKPGLIPVVTKTKELQLHSNSCETDEGDTGGGSQAHSPHSIRQEHHVG